jgi:hypothetical protein
LRILLNLAQAHDEVYKIYTIKFRYLCLSKNTFIFLLTKNAQLANNCHRPVVALIFLNFESFFNLNINFKSAQVSRVHPPDLRFRHSSRPVTKISDQKFGNETLKLLK